MNPVKDSISVVPETSVDSQEDSYYAPGGGSTGVGHGESDMDNIKIIEKPPRKRTRGLSSGSFLPRGVCLIECSSFIASSPGPSRLVQGSSKDQEVDGLAQRLTQSASFDESHSKTVWHTNDEADLWNF